VDPAGGRTSRPFLTTVPNVLRYANSSTLHRDESKQHDHHQPGHRAPGAATLQLLAGSVRLTWGGTSQIVLAGAWVAIPDAVHGVTAIEDAVALLTVGLDSR
jgi:hypothetical protein